MKDIVKIVVFTGKVVIKVVNIVVFIGIVVINVVIIDVFIGIVVFTSLKIVVIKVDSLVLRIHSPMSLL